MEIILYCILAVIAIAFLVLMFIYKRSTLTTWILEAVLIAEKELVGAGRGQEKLELVHKRLIEAFPVIGRILPFKMFSHMVDGALDMIKAFLEEAKAKQGEE
jgi:hypothetical protein